MMQIEINGNRQTIDAASIEEVRGYLRGAVPKSEVMCLLRVNGEETSEERLDTFDFASIQTIEVQTDRPEALARNAIPETIDWIQRLSEVLRSLGEDFRLGRERDAVERLVPVTDALQVLVGLLSGIREFIQMDPAMRTSLEAPWNTAESQLEDALGRFVSQFQTGDPVLLADLLGHELPRILESFKLLLEKISP
jgi:hypothetical protein